MAGHFGTLLFTQAVKELQERFGSRRHYARLEASSQSNDRLGEHEIQFIKDCDNCYIASIGETNWPYVQHRGGPKGFLRIVEPNTIAFADFRGNGQYVTTGNVATNPRVSLILVDYPRRARLKLLGQAEVFDGDSARPWLEKVRSDDYKATIERVYLIRIESFDWNCKQHIIPRYTVEQIREVLEPIEEKIETLEAENQRLRNALAQATSQPRTQGSGI